MKRLSAKPLATCAVPIGLLFVPGTLAPASADPGYPGPGYQQLYSVSYDDLCRYQYHNQQMVSGYQVDWGDQRGCSYPQDRVYGDRYNAQSFQVLSLDVSVVWPGAWQDDHGYVNWTPCGFTVSQPYDSSRPRYDPHGNSGYIAFPFGAIYWSNY